MKLLNKILSLFNNHTFNKGEELLKDKIIILNIIMFVMAPSILIFSVFRYFNQEYLQAIVDFMLVVFIGISYILLAKNKNYFLPIARFLILFSFLVALLVIVRMQGIETRFAWITLITYLIFFLLDLKEAKVWFTGMLTLITALFLVNIIDLTILEYSVFIVTTIILALFLVQYENIKLNNQKYLLNYAQELKKEVNEKTLELQEQKEMFEYLFLKSYDGILLIQDRRFIKCNDSIIKMLGYSHAKELLNTHPSELSPEFQADGENSATKADRMMQICLDTGANNFEWIHKKATGEEFWCDITLTHLRIKNRDIIHTVWRDISDKKRLEIENKNIYANLEQEVKKRTQELHLAMRAKSDFLANMSHEIRTPLSAILGFINILRRDEKDEAKQKHLNIVDTAGKSLLTIINDILDFSKIESGKLDIESKAFEIIKPFQEIHSLFFEKAKEKNIELKLNINSQLPKHVLGDIVRVKQVISNILGNAIKFTPQSGSVLMDISYDNSLLTCAIKDSGIGITKENLSTIFDEFSQADSSTTRKFGGTGLGLSISKHLIELMQGSLDVSSTFGKGATFTFKILLPEVTSSEDSQEEFNLDNLSFNPKTKILIVEDNKTNQMLLKVMLMDLDLSCDIANNGEEALNLVQQESYDIILMDENMPIMNGIEATKKIRDLGFSEIPIIAVTANALKGDREKFLNAGMNDYISKPIDMQEFIRVLKKYLHSSI